MNKLLCYISIENLVMKSLSRLLMTRILTYGQVAHNRYGHVAA